MRATRRLWLTSAAAAALLLGAADARAEEAPPDPLDEVPALGEYVEDIPTATGRKPVTKPTGGEQKSGTKGNDNRGEGGNGAPEPEPEPEPQSRELAPEVDKRIATEGGTLAPKLRKIATSPRYGAEKRPPVRERARVRRALREPDATGAPAARALGTAVTAGFGGGNTHMSILLVTLLATTAGAAGAAGYRNRPRRRD
jgi:hypothetical protein